MRKKIKLWWLVPLTLTQACDYLAVRYFSGTTINQNGPYSFLLSNTIMTIIALIVLLILLIAFEDKYQNSFFVTGIIAGGLSNVIDRWIYGGVADYISFFNISTINVADIIITACAILYAGQMIFYQKDKVSDKDGV